MNDKFLDLIKKSIDKELRDYETIKGKYIDFVVKYPNEEYGILGYENSGELYYDYKFWDEFFTKFSMESTEYEKVLMWYVGIRYDWEVKTTSSFRSVIPYFVGIRYDWKVKTTITDRSNTYFKLE